MALSIRQRRWSAGTCLRNFERLVLLTASIGAEPSDPGAALGALAVAERASLRKHSPIGLAPRGSRREGSLARAERVSIFGLRTVRAIGFLFPYAFRMLRAGEGPGKAASRYMGMDAGAYPSRTTPGSPKGINTYQEGGPPPKGYRQ